MRKKIFKLKNLFWVIRYPLRWLEIQRTTRRNRKVSEIYDILKNIYEFRVRVDREKLNLIRKMLKKRRRLRIARLDKNWFEISWIGNFSDILVLDDILDCPEYTNTKIEIIGAETVFRVEQWNSWVILNHLYHKKPVPVGGWDTARIERWVVGD